MKTVALVGACLALLASSAAAQGGFDLRWDNCFSGGGTVDKTIDCGDPGAIDVLVVTARPGVALTNVVAFDVWIDVIAGQGALLPLWQTQCDNFFDTANVGSTCPLAFVTQASLIDACGGYPFQGDPGRSRLKISGFRNINAGVSLAAGTEYTLFTLNLDHALMTDCGATGDCEQRVSFAVQRVELHVQSGSPLILDTPLRSYLAVATGPGPVPVDPSAAKDAISIVAIAPNPMEKEATIWYGLPRPGRVSLAIYDLRGRRVRQLVDGDVTEGIHTAVWDGRLDHGGRVRSGTYFVRLAFGGVTQMKRVILVQ